VHEQCLLSHFERKKTDLFAYRRRSSEDKVGTKDSARSALRPAPEYSISRISFLFKSRKKHFFHPHPPRSTINRNSSLTSSTSVSLHIALNMNGYKRSEMYGRKGRDTQKKNSGARYVERRGKKAEIFLLAWHTRASRELKQTHKKLTGNVRRRLPLSSFKKS
jgi:hypothetical protein